MSKRLFLLLTFVFLIMLIALPALAQTVADPGVVSAAAVVAIIHFLGQPVKQVVDRLRKWIGKNAAGGWRLNGPWVTGVAILAGTGISFLFSLRVLAAVNGLVSTAVGTQISLRALPEVFEYLAAGVWMALRAGYLADQEQAIDPTAPPPNPR